MKARTFKISDRNGKSYEKLYLPTETGTGFIRFNFVVCSGKNIAAGCVISGAGSLKHIVGRHLDSGCKIYTTAEIVIGVFEDVIYKREYSEDSGYEELVVKYL